MSGADFLYVYSFCSSYLVVIPIILGFLKIRTLDLNSRVLLFYLIGALAVEIISGYLSSKSIHNLFLFYIFTFVEFSCFMIILLNFLSIKNKKQLNLIGIISFGIITLVDFSINGSDHMPEISKNTEAILLMTLVILYFIQLIKSPINQVLTTTFSFWICSALIIYLSGSFFIFLFANYLLDKDPEALSILYSVIHTSFNFVFNLLLTIAITKKPHAA